MNIESSRNDAGGISIFPGARALYYDGFAYSGDEHFFFLSASLIKYAGITNTASSNPGKFAAARAQKSPSREFRPRETAQRENIINFGHLRYTDSQRFMHN